MKLSDKLIELRKTKGWSQEDFAEKLDVSRQAISRWENGTALPDAQNILRISKLFNVTADYLLNDDYEGYVETPAVEEVVEETTTEEAVTEEIAPMESEPVARKKKPPYWLIPAICGVALAACVAMIIINKTNDSKDQVHLHPGVSCLKENEVAPTCVAEGSYDEVIYCTECDEEIMRTTQSVAKLAHTLSSSVKENEVAPTCAKEGSYDEVIYCAECDEEIMRTTQSVAKLAHALSQSVKENEIAPTCTKEGSYDEVVYCSKCSVALLRTRRSIEKIAHQFQDKKCVSCGEAQPSEGLIYMSNGNGTCFVSGEECMDEHIVIPAYSPSGEKVTQIKAYAFAGNRNVKSIQIPETVMAIGEGAFQSCENLESVNLPSKLTMIKSYTFYKCKSLKEITIPKNVYYIGVEAFADCVACESIVIPASVTEIGKFAFRSFSRCSGTVTFEIYKGWVLYNDSNGYYDALYFENFSSTPAELLTFRFADCTWKRT